MKKVLLLSLVLFLVFAAQTGVQAREKTLIIGVAQEPDGWGPMFSMAVASQVERMMSVALTDRDDDWELIPAAAAYIPSIEDGTWEVDYENETMVVHWKIRDDIYYHDGTKFTVHDYVFMHDFFLNERVPIIGRARAQDVDRIEVINDYEMKVYWNTIYPFADNNAIGESSVFPRHILEEVYRKDVEAFVNHRYWTTEFVGIGPYEMIEWVPGSHIELKKNPDYFLGEPNIDRIFVRFIEDTETLKAMVRTGEVHVTLNPALPFDTAIALQREVKPGQVVIEFTPSATWEHIDLNEVEFPPFQDPRVRKALLHAIDRQAINEALFNGAYVIAHTFLPPLHALYSEETEEAMIKHEYSPDRARALLAAAGYYEDADGIMTHYETGEKLIINLRTTAGNRPREMMQEIIADYWAQIGVKMEIENLTSGVLFHPDHLYKRGWPNSILFAWLFSVTSLPDLLWHSDWIPREEIGWAGQNLAHWSNPEADKIIDEIMVTLVEDGRRELMVDLISLWTEDLPSIPLFFRVNISTWDPTIKNVKPIGTANPDTWNVHEWDIQ